jgi:hypothetical protein
MSGHECAMCGQRSEWGPGWRWYGSWADIDDGWVLKVCPACPSPDDPGALFRQRQPWPSSPRASAWSLR